MNEKINLQELSALLAEKTKISKKEAETFLREYFELLNDGLIKDGLLKIKDLGGFKLSMMDDRESVDVTTGERVLIPAHYKVVFTPDKKLAEVVNEPFSLFETTEIEDETVLEKLKPLFEKEQEIVFEKDLETKDLETEDLETKDLEIEDLETKDLETKDLETEDLETKDLETKDLETKDLETKDLETKDLEIEDLEIEDSETEEQIIKEEELKTTLVEPETTLVEPEITLVEPETTLVEPETTLVEENPTSDIFELKSYCLNCRYYEEHGMFRTLYFTCQKKFDRLTRIAYFVSIILIAALCYFLYLQQFENNTPVRKTLFIVEPSKQFLEQDSVPLPDTIDVKEGETKNETTGKTPAQNTSNEAKQGDLNINK